MTNRHGPRGLKNLNGEDLKASDIIKGVKEM